MPVSSAPVVVTGATGFVAAEIVRQLLEAGYRVRGTTRNVAAALAAGELTSLPGAGDRLDLVEADLLGGGGLDGVVADSEHVIHVASPYALVVKDPQRDLVDPAVKGTRSILEAAARTGSVRRVVLTSSFAAIGSGPRETPYTDADWNESASLEDSPYSYSKVEAERAAWEFVENEGARFDLISINPTMVFGPTLVHRVNQSHAFFIGLTDGSTPAIVAIDHPMVDVRDVARAHILAMESPTASGRYLLASGNFTPARIADRAHRLGLDDRYRLPRLRLDGGLGVALTRATIPFQRRGSRGFLRESLGRRWDVDGSRAPRELGLEYRDLDQTIDDTWSSLDELGLLGRRP